MDQIVNQAAKMRYMSGGTVKVPMVMRAPVGATGRGSQHAQSLEAFFTRVPGIKVVAPATAYDAKGLLKAAVRDDNPVLIFEHKLLYGSKGPRTEPGALSPIGEVPDEDYIVPIGKGIVRRPGKDVTIVGKLLMHVPGAGRGRGAGQGRHRGRGDRPAHAGAARQGADLRVGAQDRPAGDRRGGQPDRRLGAPRWPRWWPTRPSVWLDAPIKRVSAPDVPPPFAPVLERAYVPSEAADRDAVRSLFEGVAPCLIDVLMPPLSQTHGQRWCWSSGSRRAGEPVTKGEPLFVVETDKANLEVEAPASGHAAGDPGRAGPRGAGQVADRGHRLARRGPGSPGRAARRYPGPQANKPAAALPGDTMPTAPGNPGRDRIAW